MAYNIFTGQVVGLSKIATGTPAAFCRQVLSGSLSVDPHNISKVGIGAQKRVRKGVNEVTLECTVVGIDKVDLQLFFPLDATAQVADFPDFLVEVDDGTNGLEYTLLGGQPASCTISIGDGVDAEVEYKLTMKFTTMESAAVGTAAAVYNTYLGHCKPDIKVTVGAACDGILSMDISSDVGLEMVKTLCSGGIDADLYVVTKNDIKAAFVTTSALNADTILDDEWVAADIVLTFANGTAGENITITISDMIPTGFTLPLEAEGIVGFDQEYELADGVTYGRVVVS